MNARNKEKINELKVQQKNIIREKSELQNKLYDVQRRLEECQSIIQCEREKETIAQQYQEEDNAEYKIQLLEAQEMERQRIARDLHDSTVQDLTSMLHKIELSMRVMDMDSQRCKMELSNVLDNIRNVISNTRKMIYNLRPMSVDDIGIDVTLKHAIAKIEQEWNRKIEYIIIGKPFHVKPVVALSLLRIMQEACTNALKYADAKEICVVLEYTENDISLVIEDDGIGFNTKKKVAKTKNSGFGLSIMKERVHLLSGEIQIKSEEGKGTTISIRVPTLLRRKKMSKVKDKIEIIIADDHMMIREGLKQLLELDGTMKVIAEANDGEECLNLLNKKIHPDILLLDINMPKKNGIEVLEYIKQNKIPVKVLILTVHNEVEYLLKAVDIGIDGYLLKDSSYDELKEAIDVVISGNTYIQPSLLPALNESMEDYALDKEKIECLTKRELDVLRLISEGCSNKKISDELTISERTVKNHISHILENRCGR
ncbi:hybrid sensor histidine kinase/response regulator transcription factor [Roseburia sp. OM04-10AA]|uniref:hybrid sensor histidine kinase/response regulator transcription factor n=3 Tax=unclassified Roseburia TaxID=2637578 RepID=UPI0026A2BA75|nr:hybrid sensor histidine kinase/response regulator transcription factor [Roseburia sp. OM04-10AA]